MCCDTVFERLPGIFQGSSRPTYSDSADSSRIVEVHFNTRLDKTKEIQIRVSLSCTLNIIQQNSQTAMKPDGNPWPGTIVSLPEAENLSSEVSVEWAEQAAKISIAI